MIQVPRLTRNLEVLCEILSQLDIIGKELENQSSKLADDCVLLDIVV